MAEHSHQSVQTTAHVLPFSSYPLFHASWNRCRQSRPSLHNLVRQAFTQSTVGWWQQTSSPGPSAAHQGARYYQPGQWCWEVRLYIKEAWAHPCYFSRQTREGFLLLFISPCRAITYSNSSSKHLLKELTCYKWSWKKKYARLHSNYREVSRPYQVSSVFALKSFPPYTHARNNSAGALPFSVQCIYPGRQEVGFTPVSSFYLFLAWLICRMSWLVQLRLSERITTL